MDSIVEIDFFTLPWCRDLLNIVRDYLWESQLITFLVQKFSSSSSLSQHSIHIHEVDHLPYLVRHQTAATTTSNVLVDMVPILLDVHGIMSFQIQHCHLFLDTFDTLYPNILPPMTDHDNICKRLGKLKELPRYHAGIILAAEFLFENASFKKLTKGKKYHKPKFVNPNIQYIRHVFVHNFVLEKHDYTGQENLLLQRNAARLRAFNQFVNEKKYLNEGELVAVKQLMNDSLFHS